MWKRLILMSLGLVALVGCNSDPNLTQVSDVGLATRMAQACGDLEIAVSYGFDAPVDRMTAPLIIIRRVINAIEPRVNLPLQYIRTYTIEGLERGGGLTKVRQACAIATVYSQNPWLSTQSADAWERLAQQKTSR